MPGRKAKPPRLWFREDDATWIVLHRGRQIRTGCSRDDLEGAAKALEIYIGSNHKSTVGATDPRFLAIADVITFYERLKRPKGSDPRREAQHELLLIRLEDLNAFFGARMVSDIKAQLCRDFVDWSTGTVNENNRKAGITPRARIVSDQTARRRLEDLRAAINAYHAEHVLNVVPKITLPEKADGRHRWLTRNEAARLVGAAIGFVWDLKRKTWKRREDGSIERRERWIIERRRPAARFMLIGLYSARREETIRRTQWLQTLTHPWMNLDAMIYQGRGTAEERTKKRRPPAKIANRLRPHLVRWRRLDAARTIELRSAGLMDDDEEIIFVVHRTHDGRPLAGKIRSAWEGMLEDAGLGEDVVRHTLRHTAATWSMQAGTDMWQAAGWLGMTVEQLQDNYGHHHPDFQSEAAEAFGGRRS
ncbi:tyrosine-type recombinase/integrase [Bradyrhizobium erythrophlei]|uniref:Phage integrase family protein n=1 Tax=Bradyrhizobium erythrophlei TaxID=1437360 RepID=A0A1M7T790_9BRAD|nr:tyrosine-type recombinase/integrase [Bradyrhizobium erythrophlei]SHN66589.1 Phage integrase family protein [Bradyrhizobium erythrophlei]